MTNENSASLEEVKDLLDEYPTFDLYMSEAERLEALYDKAVVFQKKLQVVLKRARTSKKLSSKELAEYVKYGDTLKVYPRELLHLQGLFLQAYDVSDRLRNQVKMEHLTFTTDFLREITSKDVAVTFKDLDKIEHSLQVSRWLENAEKCRNKQTRLGALQRMCKESILEDVPDCPIKKFTIDRLHGAERWMDQASRILIVEENC